MRPDELSYRRFEYAKEGVTASIPTQTRGIRVKPKLNTLVWEPGMREQANFTPIRLIINMEFNDEDTDEMLEEFEPPFEFQVNYTLEDRESTRGKGKSMKIAYWKDNQWKLITEESHKLTDKRSTSGRGVAGVLRFEIKYWGEPTIALGE